LNKDQKVDASRPIPSVNPASVVAVDAPTTGPRVDATARTLDVRAVFDAHGGFVWRALRRLGVSEANVDDVAQEVFLVVHNRLGDFDDRAGMRAWLYGISARKASEHRRRAWVRREHPVEDLPDAGAPPEQLVLVEKRQAVAILEGILAKLDPKHREVFVLFELEQLPLAEVALAVGCPLQTAYSRLQVARANVQAAVARAQKGAT
jgi:RNA polymerase sigma-70 factor, ECF subfamily